MSPARANSAFCTWAAACSRSPRASSSPVSSVQRAANGSRGRCAIMACAACISPRPSALDASKCAAASRASSSSPSAARAYQSSSCIETGARSSCVMPAMIIRPSSVAARPKSSAPQVGYSCANAFASESPASMPSAFAASLTRVSIRVTSAFSGVRSKPISVFRSMPSARASAGSSVTSGYDAPCSHLLTAGALTPSRSASCSCVMPSACLRERMVSFMLSIGHASFLTSGL